MSTETMFQERVRKALSVEDIKQKKKLLADLVKQNESNNARRMNEMRNGDPSYVYLWAYNHPDKISFYEARGYTLVTEDDPVVTAFKKDGGVHQRGDAILMRCPRELVEAYRAMEDQWAAEQVDSYENTFLDYADQHNIPIRETRKGRRG